MTHRILAALTCVLFFSVSYARAQQTGQSEDERYIIESERQWAESVASGDADAEDLIVSEDPQPH
jgi:hypothetical protein